MKTTPFNHDLWKAGKGKAVYRNGQIPGEIVRLETHTGNWPIMTTLRERIFSHDSTGRHLSYIQDSEWDILLQIEPTYVPLEQKDWIIDGPWWVKFPNSPEAYLVIYLERDEVWTEKGSFSPEHLLTWLRTNAERMSDPSIPEDEKWVACRKEAM